jgi:folate-dependent phosphoribosylglycinamide formyltransferase PurN
MADFLAFEAEHNYPVTLLASGSGTTVEAFSHAIVANNLPIEVVEVICDRPGEKVLDKVRRLNLTHGWDTKPSLIDKETFPGGPGDRNWDITDEQSEEIARHFEESGVVMGMQLGWASRTRGVFFEQWGSLPQHTCAEEADLANLHPSFKKETAGKYGHGVHELRYAQTRESGVYTTAMTLHVVTANYDEGATFSEREIRFLESDGVKEIEETENAFEKAFVAQDLLEFLRRKVSMGLLRPQRMPDHPLSNVVSLQSGKARPDTTA